MKRRNFLKSLGAIGLAPVLPMSALAKALPVAEVAVPADTYQWAAMIVRAHNSCSVPMLQRLLNIDGSLAEAVQSQLLKNGIINMQTNAFGIRTAVKPLHESAFLNPPGMSVASVSEKPGEVAKSLRVTQNDDELSDEAEAPAEFSGGFDEADVEMVGCADVLAILEDNRVNFMV